MDSYASSRYISSYIKNVSYISFCFATYKNHNAEATMPAVGMPAVVSNQLDIKIVT